MEIMEIETGETKGNYNPNNSPFLKELLEPEIYVKTFNVPDYDLTIPAELVNEINLDKPDNKFMYIDPQLGTKVVNIKKIN